MDLAPDERAELIRDIATRAGTGKQIARRYGLTLAALKRFVAENMDELEAYSEPPEPTDITDLWISNKFERLKRIERVADAVGDVIERGGVDQALIREYRSLLALAANELGQLLHRGSGENADSTLLEVDMMGVNMENLK